MTPEAYTLLAYLFITVFVVNGVIASVVLWGAGLIAFVTRGKF